MFYPIAPLRAPSADISLHFLSANAIRFAQPTSDPWFRAARPGASGGAWSSDYALSSATIDAVLAYPSILRNDDERAFLQWLRRIKDSGWSSPYDLVSVLGVSALRARQTLRWGLQGPLPSDQWQDEVEGWFDMALAGLQLSYRETATGPADAGVPVDPQTVGDKHCGMQKIRSGAYVNVSAVGLLVIFLVGGVVVMASYVVEPLTACVQARVQRRRGGGGGGGSYSRLEWVSNDVLQLQRLAHEELGLGGEWRNCAGAVPTTAKAGDVLAVLDVADPRHPRLKRPPLSSSTVFEEVTAEEVAAAEAREREREEEKRECVRVEERREVGEVSPTVSMTLTEGDDEDVRWVEREEEEERQRERDWQRRGSV
ncbi:hypothetical protein SLS54_008327 [Diplodia seriata]